VSPNQPQLAVVDTNMLFGSGFKIQIRMMGANAIDTHSGLKYLEKINFSALNCNAA
jgi:hypothetical protein